MSRIKMSVKYYGGPHTYYQQSRVSQLFGLIGLLFIPRQISYSSPSSLPILDGAAFNHLAILLLIGSGKLQSGQAIFIHCFNVDQMVKEQCYTLPSTKIVINIVAEDGFKWITCKNKKNVIM